MRETVMTDRELAIMSARENLTSISRRPGYAEAMKQPKVGWTATIVCIVVAIGFAGLTYASWENIDATWLRWVVVLFFGAISGLAALLAIGASPKLDTAQRFGVAVIAKLDDPDKSKELTLLKEDGSEVTVPTNDQIFQMTRVGDFGVAVLGKDEPHELADFTRL